MKWKRTVLSLVLILSLCVGSEAYAAWAKTYGGGTNEEARSVLETSDSGYILAGWTNSFGMGGSDFLVVKLNSSGGIAWQKTFGGTGTDIAYAVRETYDAKYGAGYIVAGETNSFGAGDYDGLLLKLDATGALTWAKTLGGSTWDQFYSAIQASDGYYVAAGRTASYGAGLGDVLVSKIAINGVTLWTKAYGGAYYEEAHDIRETSDGGYVVAGYTDSFGAGRKDLLILKISSSGALQWAKAHGGVNSDEAFSIQQTSDGGYIVAGYSWTGASESEDYLILKLSATGGYQWHRTFGYDGTAATGDERAHSVQQTSDGGYIVAGTRDGTYSYDFYYLKLTAAGAKQWEYIFTPNNQQLPGVEKAYSVQQTSDGGYVIGGGGYYEFFITKLNATGTIPGCPRIWDVAFPNPFVQLYATTVSLAVATPSVSTATAAVAVADVALTQYTVCGGGVGGCAGTYAEASPGSGTPPAYPIPWSLLAALLVLLGGALLVRHARTILKSKTRGPSRR